MKKRSANSSIPQHFEEMLRAVVAEKKTQQGKE